MKIATKHTIIAVESRESVYCPICTHTVEAAVLTTRKASIVKPGQRCGRCKSTLDAGYVFRFERAA
jgi:hypothetical protein